MELMEVQKLFIIGFCVAGFLFLAGMYWAYQKRNKFFLKKDHIRPELFFLLFAAIAFLIRYIIASEMPGYQSDVDCFKAWSNSVYSGGFENFYNSGQFADYPPLYIYVLYILGGIREACSIDMMSSYGSFFIKLPAILCDIILAYVVYRFAKKKLKSHTMGLFFSILILFNPALIMNSAIWGQMDVILTLFLILTLYLLCEEKILWAAVAFSLALLLKPQAILLGPVILAFLIYHIVKSKEKRKAVLQLVIAVALFLAVFLVVPLPFSTSSDGPFWLVERYAQTMGEYPYASLNAFNLFAMLGGNFIHVEQATFLSLPANVWGYIGIAFICIYTIWLFYKRPQKKFLFALSAFLLMGIFALGHSMHERYLFPVPVLLLFAYFYMKDKRLILSAVLNFAILMLNQGISLYYYQVFIPMEIMVLCSALAMAIFVYTGYVITRMALHPDTALETEPERYEPLDAKQSKEKKNADLKMRLDTFETKKYISKKDGLIMLVISAAYAIVAFTNLGVFEIPKTATTLNQEVSIQLPQQENISELKYYAGFGEAEFRILYSSDGQNYIALTYEEDGTTHDVITHELKDLYKWHHFELNAPVQSLRVVPVKTGEKLPILEMALYDANGAMVQGIRATTQNGQPVLWFDEQDLVPAERTYMTDFYFDELYHVRTAYENIHHIHPYEITHPPLGKIIIASGIELFGMNPFGWRFMGTLTGVLMLPVIYIMAKMLIGKRKFAAFATILFAADFMHFAQTRIGTIDSYSVLFIMLMYLFMYRYALTNFNKQPLKKTLIPLFFCGLFFGLGAATKWLCIYAGLGLLALFLILMYKRYQEYRYALEHPDEYPDIIANYKRNLGLTLAFCVLVFIVIPAVIYVLSYIPYMLVEGETYGFKQILDNQFYMLNYHGNLSPERVHPFSSKWFSWIVDYRPVLFFSKQNAQAGTIATLSTMGNPLIWWTGAVAAFWLIVDAYRNKHRSKKTAFIAIALLSQLLPWVLISREVFIYHYFASVPFLILLLVYWLKYLEKDFKYGKQFGIIFVIACVAMFAFFYPVITGVPANADYINGLRWIQSWPFY